MTLVVILLHISLNLFFLLCIYANLRKTWTLSPLSTPSLNISWLLRMRKALSGKRTSSYAYNFPENKNLPSCQTLPLSYQCKKKNTDPPSCKLFILLLIAINWSLKWSNSGRGECFLSQPRERGCLSQITAHNVCKCFGDFLNHCVEMIFQESNVFPAPKKRLVF